ncbi:MAG: tyrosine-type recombinase/integrase [Acidimicrobiales bacterium]
MTDIDVNVRDYLEWMQIHNYAETTIDCRRRYLCYFMSFLASRNIVEAKDVTLEDLLDYQRSLFEYRKRGGQPLSFGTQIQRLVPVAQFFSWLRREHRLVENPATDLLMPRPERSLPEATLTANEMSALLRAPEVSKPLGLRDRAVLEVFYSCGLRRGELISLWLRDVDFERGTVFIRRGKGAKDRYVPIGERALFWLRLYVDVVRPRFVSAEYPNHLFLSSSGTPLCPDWLCRKVRAYLAMAGIDKKGSCHLLRHTVATLMLEGGADIRYVAEMLGHARLETTQRYTRVSIDHLRVVHANAHPAAGLGVAMAAELLEALPGSKMTAAM